MRNVTRMLKTLMLLAVSMFVFVSFGFAQQTVLLTESFESGNGTTPPAGWTIEQVTGTTLGISFVTSSTYPTITAAYDGTKFVKYNSFNISSGSTRLKRTVAMSTTNHSFVMVDFAWYEDPGYSTSADRVDVQWSTNGTTWTTAGTFNRYNAVAGWKMKNVVLPSGANNQATLYVAFLFTSAYGNNCDMDMVKITCGPAAPPAFATIGTGTTTVGWPYYTFYMGSRTQMLYTAADLTAAGASAGQLNSVGFNIQTAYPQVMQNFTIKMGHTTATTLTGWVTSGMTTVYQTNYGVPGTGWRDVNLTTPFNWNGTGNVLVEICFGDNGSYTSNSMVYGTAVTGRTWHYHADNYAGCTGTMTGAVQTTTPNIRFGIPPVSPGVLMGYVKDQNTLAPIANAIVQVSSTLKDTTDANGFYIIYNINAGPITANATASGYISGSGTATIVNGVATSLDILLAPGPKVGGTVTDASTGNPIVGAQVFVGGILQTMSVAGGTYLTPLLSLSGAQPVLIRKTGYIDFISTATLVPNTTFTQDAALLPEAVQPGPFTATLNNPTNPTAVNLNWEVPQGMYQLIYDDGIQDNFAIWATPNNLNALKFTPLNWPVKLLGGKVNLGVAANYPSNALPLTKFVMMACKADGTGGTPGTVIDSVEVTPTGFGWADFTFASPLTITSGDFYLVMKQGGFPPHAAGVGIDLTTTSLRSYSKFISGGAPWIPAAGTFMMRAIVQGVGGPMDGLNAGQKQLITAGQVEGLIYEAPVATVTGYESDATTAPVVWSELQNTFVGQQVNFTAVTQPSEDAGIGSTLVNNTIVLPTEAPAALLYDNGSMVNSPGTGAGGLDESLLQAPLTSFGSNFNKAAYYKVADDFTVTGSPWNVSSIEFYGYQTGSTTTSSFTAAYVRIWNGQPGASGATVIWGDTTTNRLSSTSFSNIYRVSVTGNTQRPIMKLIVNTTGLSLNAGTYWIEFSALGSIASGPWCPYITINNTPVTGNGVIFTGTATGYVPINATYGQGVPFKINGSQQTTSSMSYQVWRLKQGQEGNEPLWTSIWTGNTNSTVDNGWPSLPCEAYRWAVKAIYSPPGQRFSAPTFSNVIGKCWTANVDVCVSLTCAVNPKAGTIVTLTHTQYPDTTYTATTDTSGCVTFTNVWKGTYVLSAIRFTYPVYTQNITIMGDGNYNIMMLQTTDPPTNLVVNDQSLEASWSPPRSQVFQLNENFSGGFTTNQWVVSGGTNWQISNTVGNPAPSAMFNWTPQVTNYHQYLTSKSLAGVHAPQMKLMYDIYLDNFGTTYVNYMAVELWNGTTWSVLKTYDNSNGSFPWDSEVLDISSQTHNPAFKVRFHAYGDDSYDINNWNVDNVRVYSTDGTSGPNPCVIGYNFYLNNVLSAFTPDTTYNIPPNQVVYGQTYNACVKAVYGSGYSPQICVTFTSHFLYPARELEVEGIECNAYLSWKKPVMLADGPQILSITPRTVDPNSIADVSPWNVTTSAVTGDNTEALWDLMFAWPTSTNQETAVVCIGDFIYTCRWSGGPTWFYKYQKTTGVQVETFDIPGSTANRDFGWDGTNAYGTGYTTTINKLDLAGHTIVSSLATSGAGSIRHIAFDPVNNGFWVGDWNTMFLVSASTGAVIATGPAVVNVYGSAYDPDPAGPFLWLHSHTSSAAGDEIQQYKITGTTLTSTGVTFDVATLPGFPSGGIAGGLETVDHAGKFGLLGGVQNLNWVFAVELRAGGGPIGGTPPGLIGYNIYRNSTFIHYNPHPDSITYYDYGLNPGTYKYDVKARYDLTPYGFPGQFGESLENTAGEQTVTLNCGTPLPFYEPWDQGSFAFQNWQPGAHWTMNTGIGNPAPCADFVWNPAVTNYSFALTSEVIDASPWTCASIWLDFDVKLIDRNNTGKEKLTVDLFYNGSWHQKLEISNNGSTGWVSKHIDISSVKGKSFRIRFVANGENSADLLHWYVDNVHAYGICKAPTNLNKTQSQFTTTLTWTAPSCGGSSGQLMWFIFDDGTAESGWVDSGEVGWLGNEFPISNAYDGVLKEFKMYFMANPSGQPFPLQVDVFDQAKVLVGSTPTFTPSTDDWVTVMAPDIPFAGKFYAMVKWNNNPTQTNYLGWDEDGPYAAQNLGWYNYQGAPAWLKLNDPSIGGTAGVFTIQAKALVGADLKEVVLVPGEQPTPVAVGPNTHLSKVNRKVDTHFYGVMGPETDDSDSSVLVGYNVYRTGIDAMGQPPYNMLNTSAVTATTYVDTYPSTTEPGKTLKYYVTSIYKNSENNEVLCEASSDTISVTFPAVGMNELTSGQVSVYPNPATEVINVKSDYTISRIDVMNFVGQTVYTSKVDSKISKLDVTGFVPGVYFVKVSTSEGIRTVKITVTH